MGAVLDEVLQRAFPKGAVPIRFLQIGGNDGVYQDPLYEHHVRATFDFEWGHIFEPIPEYFEKLTMNMRPFWSTGWNSMSLPPFIDQTWRNGGCGP